MQQANGSRQRTWISNFKSNLRGFIFVTITDIKSDLVSTTKSTKRVQKLLIRIDELFN